MTENINISKQCRTCLKGSKGFQLLSKWITEKKEETKSYADFLKDITHIDVMNETYNDMPQLICACCIRRLKACYVFVRQAQEVHNKFWSMLYDENKKPNCLQEEQIDIENCIEIKVDNEEANRKRDKKLEEFETSDAENGNETKNVLREAVIESTLDRRKDRIEPKIVMENKFTSKCEDDYSMTNIFHEDCFKPEEFSDSDVESKSSTDSDWCKETAHTKSIKQKGVDDNIPVSCDQCDRIFQNSRLLRRHKSRTHVPEELKVQCPFCPAKYARRYYMYAHMRTNHKDEPIEEHITKQSRKFPRQYSCEHCEGTYTSKYYLVAHKKLKHDPDNVSKKSERILLPKKRFLCALCGCKFESPSNLNVHVRRHTGEKPFKCDLCDRTFYRPCDVQVHRRSHTGEKPFICKICEKAFAKSNKLKIHMRAHSNERPYKCDQCEKAFKDSKNLKIHKRLHTGERPYICVVCHTGFIKSTSLKLHQTKTQHFDTAN